MTPEQKREIIANKKAQYEIHQYDLEVSVRVFQKTGQDEMVQQATDNLKKVEKAIDELDAISAEIG
jgi:hypothetical protein